MSTWTLLQLIYVFVFIGAYKYLNRTRDHLQSPLYPNNYPSNAKYAWLIELLSEYIIDVIFDDFKLEFSVNCTNDYLEIFDGSDNSSVSLGKYCGAKKPSEHVKSSGNVMYIEFSSNRVRTTKGFRISYNAIKSGDINNFKICRLYNERPGIEIDYI